MDDSIAELMKWQRIAQQLVDSYTTMIRIEESSAASDKEYAGSLSLPLVAELYRARAIISERIVAAFKQYVENEINELAKLDQRIAVLEVKPPGPMPDTTSEST